MTAPSDRCVIVAGGAVDPPALRQAIEPTDFVVGVDSGAVTLLEADLRPDLAIGDFDSAGPEGLRQLLQAGVPLKRHPVEKNSTDLELALELATGELKCDEVLVFGGVGTRIDQSMATFFVMGRLAGSGAALRLWDSHWQALFLHGEGNREARISGSPGTVVSLLPLSPLVAGVRTEGLYYPLDNATLNSDTTLGISNILEGHEAVVSIDTGQMAVIINAPGSD